MPEVHRLPSQPHPREIAFRSACAALALLPSVVRSTARTSRIIYARRIISACLYHGPFAMSYPVIAETIGVKSHGTAREAAMACASMIDDQMVRTDILAVWRAIYGSNPPDSVWDRIRDLPNLRSGASMPHVPHSHPNASAPPDPQDVPAL